jgi:hypothetical protein
MSGLGGFLEDRGLRAVVSYVVTGEGVLSRKSDRGNTMKSVNKALGKRVKQTYDVRRVVPHCHPSTTSRRLPRGYYASGRSCGATPDQDPHRTLQVERERNSLY